jgi:hypothetical protein
MIALPLHSGPGKKLQAGGPSFSERAVRCGRATRWLGKLFFYEGKERWIEEFQTKQGDHTITC